MLKTRAAATLAVLTLTLTACGGSDPVREHLEADWQEISAEERGQICLAVNLGDEVGMLEGVIEQVAQESVDAGEFPSDVSVEEATEATVEFLREVCAE